MIVRIGILALQGAFIEHERMLERLGISSFEIRQRGDLSEAMDGLILPGGESTAQGKLLRELGLFAPLRGRILSGLPVFGTTPTGGSSAASARSPTLRARGGFP